MHVWFPHPATEPGEEVVFQAVAYTFRGRRSIGGTVTVTRGRLLFTPNRLDGLTGVPPITIDRSAVRRVWVEPAGSPALRERGLAAALRPQVCIDHPEGPTFLTLSGPEELVSVLDGSGP